MHAPEDRAEKIPSSLMGRQGRLEMLCALREAQDARNGIQGDAWMDSAPCQKCSCGFESIMPLPRLGEGCLSFGDVPKSCRCKCLHSRVDFQAGDGPDCLDRA